MKKFVFLMAFTTTLSLFCDAQVKKYDDDIYYSPKDAKPAGEVAPKTQNTENNVQQPATTTTEAAPVAGNATAVNNTSNDFKYDDYYDYAYASRLKRFHNSSMGYNYYDSYYTNSYWYDNNPSNFGVNIYVGSGWGSPYYGYRPYYYYDPFYNPWYYNPWSYNPYWSYRPYYYPYYSHNYWHGHHGGWNDNYYPYSTNSHYGPRGGAVSSSGTTYPNRADGVNEPRFNRAGGDGNNVVAPRGGANNSTTTSPRTEPRFERPGGNKAADPNTNKLPENNNTTVPTQPNKADRPRFGRDPGTQQQQEPRPNNEQQVPKQQEPRYERQRENRNSGYESPRNNSSGGQNSGGNREGGRVSRPR